MRPIRLRKKRYEQRIHTRFLSIEKITKSKRGRAIDAHRSSAYYLVRQRAVLQKKKGFPMRNVRCLCGLGPQVHREGTRLGCEGRSHTEHGVG
jgi:hypothetical protein